MKTILFTFLIIFGLTQNCFAERIAVDSFNSVLRRLNDDYKNHRITDSTDLSTISDYSRIEYKFINSGLRNEDLLLLEGMSEHICRIDALLKKYPIKMGNVTVYRGHGYLQPHGKERGFEFFDLAYTSTSISKDVAMQFLKNRDTKVLDIIEVPTDSIPSFWVNPVANVNTEFEILLPRGLRFKVVDVKIQELEPSRFTSSILVIRRLKIIGFESRLNTERTLDCKD